MDNMCEFEEIALFLFTVLLSIIASISVWKVGPKRSEGRGKRVAINLIIVYHFPGLREYIGAQLIVCAPFLLFVKDGRPEFCGR